MKIWRGLLGAAVLVCAVLCVTSVTVVADDGTHTHPICGATHTDIGDHVGECADVVWTAWDGTTDIDYGDSNTAYVYLTGNAAPADMLKITSGKTLYLCLNGYSITSTDDGTSAFDAVITVYDEARLVLCDCKNDTGTITHLSGMHGRGVRVGAGSKAAFTMYGGTISGNHVGTSGYGADGGGVEIQNGTFTMYGGKITDNHVDVASNYGGGAVCAQSSGAFIMYGGEISNNSSAGSGGGVSAWGGAARLYGGTISGNTADGNGGGIWLNSRLPISGSFSIINNTAVNGGGVYVKGPLTLSDNASITDNKASNGNGGGVYCTNTWSDNILTISDSGEIARNTATGDGGGIYIDKGNLVIEGGSITDNTGTGNGGGVYFSGSTFKISGGISITGNKKNSDANNIYLAKYKSVAIVGELTGTTPIGITTEVTPDSSSYVRIASGNAEYAKPDKFQYENSNTPISVILNSSGSTATLVVCEHNWGTIWKTDTTSHWHECAICKGKNDIATHIGGTATCTEKAMCEVCDQLYGNVLGHDIVHHEAKAVTCTEKGWNAYDTCSRCDYTTYVELNALGHDFTGDTWQSDADWHWKKCSHCEVIDEKAQHTGGTATCRDSAVCTICSKTYLNSGNHVGGAEIRGMTEATDEKAGYTGDSYCKGCNTKLSDGTTIPMISNLSVGMKRDLAAAVDAMEKILNAQSSVYTDEQKKQLVDSINAIKTALESIENTEEAVKKVEAMPAADKTQPDDKAAIDAYEAAKNAYDALSADEKRMAGESTKTALDTMLKALTAYDVTYGNGSNWMENDKNTGLTFTVNGYHKKFAGIVINGVVVDKKYYDIAVGSTIITLKAEYLQTLPAGKYTLLVQYTDGSTDGEDTFTITKNETTTSSNPTATFSPKTADNSKLGVWISIMLVSAGISMILLQPFKKRK